jgi:hypothetical protein
MRRILALSVLFLLFYASSVLANHIDPLTLFTQEEQGTCAPAPTTAKEVASTIGGAPGDWTHSGERSWTYTGSNDLSFTVQGCPWSLPDGTKHAGDTVTLSAQNVLTWPEPT